MKCVCGHEDYLHGKGGCSFEVKAGIPGGYCSCWKFREKK